MKIFPNFLQTNQSAAMRDQHTLHITDSVCDTAESVITAIRKKNPVRGRSIAQWIMRHCLIYDFYFI